jgi:endonuclease/exonuclease/phosphatase family metal-dependent hydrolase
VYTLVASGLADAIRNVGVVNTEDSHLASDHRPFWIDLDLSTGASR